MDIGFGVNRSKVLCFFCSSFCEVRGRRPCPRWLICPCIQTRPYIGKWHGPWGLHGHKRNCNRGLNYRIEKKTKEWMLANNLASPRNTNKLWNKIYIPIPLHYYHNLLYYPIQCNTLYFFIIKNIKCSRSISTSTGTHAKSESSSLTASHIMQYTVLVECQRYRYNVVDSWL
jgi:hypothetical protein